MRNRLIIIGASGHGKSVADVALKMNQWKTIAFIDDSEQEEFVMGIEVIGKSSDVDSYINDSDVFVAIGNNTTRQKIQNRLENEGASIPTLIHPTAIIGKQVEIDSGTVIMAGVIIDCCTNIGKGCIVNKGVIIDHDNKVGGYVHLSPGVNIAGTVTVGDLTWLGIGSNVSNNVNITSNCQVGAGGVVVRDITEPGTYVGVPVRKI